MFKNLNNNKINILSKLLNRFIFIIQIIIYLLVILFFRKI